MSVKLWRGVTVFMIWPRRRVLELRRDHLAGSDRRFVPSASGLDIGLEYFQSLLHALSMRDSHAFVIANQSGKRNRFGRAESGIPTGSMFTCRDLFAIVIDCLPR